MHNNFFKRECLALKLSYNFDFLFFFRGCFHGHILPGFQIIELEPRPPNTEGIFAKSLKIVTKKAKCLQLNCWVITQLTQKCEISTSLCQILY